MWGHSMGGFITLRCMVIGEDVKAGVIWGGVVATYPDMFGWFHKSPAVSLPTHARRWRYDLMERYGTPEENPAFWASLSANAYLADLSGPLQLHHSTTDEEVPVDFSESLVEQVQAVGGEVELFTYPGDNHNISANFGAAIARSVEFFDRYLK
ncbi:MAG: alpha/beta hydrolase family protein [Anaerolineae bacterium]